jgi:23S rRNA (guanine745-N1)-methyltransferase
MMLRCPVCGGDMSLFSGHPQRVACEKGHSYDVGRWVNFLTRPVTGHYRSSLFQARRLIWNSGLFDRLAHRLAELIGPEAVLLDAGCGEGSPLIRLLDCHVSDHPALGEGDHAPNKISNCYANVENKTNRINEAHCLAVGIDLAKDGIRLASGLEKRCEWVVGDLTQLPFQDNSFDVVVNLLSPACYDEFVRVLKPSGRLFKIIPENGYLQEIRALISGPQSGSSLADDNIELLKPGRITSGQSLGTPREAITDRLERLFSNYHSERLHYSYPIDPTHKFNLVRMTPMCADHSDEECATIADRLGDTITIDLRLITASCKPDN